uniref:Putative secreted protein n=1 Tax=Amblyomma cajennense TaxID=34607 RepID=A0A023FBX5_AMBCJ
MIVYTFFCCALLALPCFAIPSYDRNTYDDAWSIARINRTCPLALFAESLNNVTRPVGCKCGGRFQNLTAGTVCYVPGSWEGTKYAPGVLFCTLGRCNFRGQCMTTYEGEPCPEGPVVQGRPK